jgi:hypothetical protein
MISDEPLMVDAKPNFAQKRGRCILLLLSPAAAAVVSVPAQSLCYLTIH